MIPSGVVATPRWDADFAGLPLNADAYERIAQQKVIQPGHFAPSRK